MDILFWVNRKEPRVAYLNCSDVPLPNLTAKHEPKHCTNSTPCWTHPHAYISTSPPAKGNDWLIESKQGLDFKETCLLSFNKICAAAIIFFKCHFREKTYSVCWCNAGLLKECFASRLCFLFVKENNPHGLGVRLHLHHCQAYRMTTGRKGLSMLVDFQRQRWCFRGSFVGPSTCAEKTPMSDMSTVPSDAGSWRSVVAFILKTTYIFVLLLWMSRSAAYNNSAVSVGDWAPDHLARVSYLG